MNRQVLRSSLILTCAGIVCKFLGVFFRIPLTNILGTEGIGVFQMAMSLFSFALILCSGGITITLSKLISENHNNSAKCSQFVKKALIICISIGIVVGGIFAILCGKIANIQRISEIKMIYILMPILLPLGGVIACFRGYLQGLERMFPTAISQVIEQSCKFIFGLALAKILIKYGIQWGVFGGFIGILLSEIVVTIYLFFKCKFIVTRSEEKEFFKTLLPIYLSSLVFPFLTAFDSIFISKILIKAGISIENAKILYGIESGIVGSMLNLPLILSTAVATSILPNLSKIKDEGVFTQKCEEGFKILWFILLPMVLGIMAVSRPLYLVLYPNLNNIELNLAVSLTRFGGVATILTGVAQYIISILEAKGKLITVLIIEMLAASVKIGSLLLCIMPGINIYGIIIGRILMMAIICVLGLIFAKEIKCQSFSLFLPLLSSIMMFLVVEIISNKINFAPIVNLFVMIFIGIATYLSICFPILLEEIKKFHIFNKKKKV